MPDQVQLRGGTEGENDAFTGANREVTVDTTNKTLRIHDGATSGGSKLAAYDEWGRLQVADPQSDDDVVNKGFMDTAIADSVPTSDNDFIATSESTSSDSFTDLATVGPSVTVDIPASGKALVIVAARGNNSVADNGLFMGWDGAGLSADFARAAGARPSNTSSTVISWATVVDGLSTGEQTFTAKYRRLAGGTASFADRHISVIPLPQ